MFIKVDIDYFVNIEKISAYLLKEEDDAIRLIIYVDGKIAHNLVYLKCDSNAMLILSGFISAMRGVTFNPELTLDQVLKLQNKKEVETDVNKEQN